MEKKKIQLGDLVGYFLDSYGTPIHCKPGIVIAFTNKAFRNIWSAEEEEGVEILNSLCRVNVVTFHQVEKKVGSLTIEEMVTHKDGRVRRAGELRRISELEEKKGEKI